MNNTSVAKKFGRRYPWKRWFRHKTFSLRRGEHYDGRTYIMAQMVRNAATRHGLRVRVVISDDEDTLTVTVTARGDAQRDLFAEVA